MNILITGINGFVGSNFVNDWGKRHNLYGLDIRQPEKKGVKQTFAWDRLGSVPTVNAVVHLAGKAHDTDNKSDAKSYFDVNTGLTQRIFDWFLQSDAQTFIFFSSVKAAADFVPGEVLTEDVKPNPVGPYGESKIKAEAYILSKRAVYESKEKRVFIVRPAMIHGPGNKGNLNLLYQVVKSGIPWPLGAYENRRSFCSIDNISFVVEQLIIRDGVPGGIYHVCDDEAVSTNELIGTMCEAMGKKARIWKLPQEMIHAIAGVGTLLRLPLNRFRLQKLTENYVVSNQKIKNALDIESLPVSAKEGIVKTVKSFS